MSFILYPLMIPVISEYVYLWNAPISCFWALHNFPNHFFVPVPAHLGCVPVLKFRISIFTKIPPNEFNILELAMYQTSFCLLLFVISLLLFILWSVQGTTWAEVHMAFCKSSRCLTLPTWCWVMVCHHLHALTPTKSMTGCLPCLLKWLF